MNESLDAFRAEPTTRVFAITRRGLVDFTTVWRAGRRATAILAEPTAESGSRRASADTAILPTHSVGR